MRVLTKPEALDVLKLQRKRLLNATERCMMCALARTPQPDALIHEDATCRVVLDRLGNRKGHLLVIPKRHVDRFSELPIGEFRRVQDAVFFATRALETALSPRRVFYAATGATEELPMSFPHFHVHVVPVDDTDERARPASVLSWTEGVVVYDDYEAEQLARSIAVCWEGDDRRSKNGEAACVEH